MSSVNDKELREAAERLMCIDPDVHESYYGDGKRVFSEDVDVVAAWVLSELARRDAEAVERGKPLDREYIRSLGSETVPDEIYPNSRGNDNELLRINGSSLILWPFNGECWLIRGQDQFELKTRGQLDDLIAALKGGAK